MGWGSESEADRTIGVVVYGLNWIGGHGSIALLAYLTY